MIQEPSKPIDWAAIFGGALVLGFIGLVMLAALGGWGWMSAFLVSAAPNWMQGIGSLLAIGVAIWIMDRQHRLEIQRNAERLRQERRRQLRAISIILHSAADPCGFAMESCQDPDMQWTEHGELLRECRARLLAVPLPEIPNVNLLVAIEKAVRDLWICVGLTTLMKNGGGAAEAARMFEGTMDTCLVGAAEALGAFRAMSTAEELASETLFYPDFAESKARVERAKASVAAARLKARHQAGSAL